ncbi:MAG TPA: chromosomal replication initiator protein DnaA [Phycisphaerae bacterium]|nr:chromosomal replication initiator protein DnaA [Phycisphaerae bacterium]
MNRPGNVCAQDDRTKEILGVLGRRIGPQKFNAWFKHGTSIGLEDGHVKIGAANPFIASWIERHFAEDVSASAAEVTGESLRLIVSVDSDLSGRLRKRQLDTQAMLVSRGTAGTTRQSPRPARRLRYHLEDFVVGPSNRLAYSAAEEVSKTGQAPFNPLFIHGTCGVGKTHLLQGICNAVTDRPSGAATRWKYITAEQFTNEFVQAVRKKKVEGFRQAYRHLDVLVIDDVHFLAAKKATQEEFLHTFNTIEGAGKQVIMASDAHPKMLGQLAEQLVSRFMSGMVVRVDPPTRDTRVKILRRFATRLHLEVPDDVADYVAMHTRGSVRELEGALLKLAALAALAREPVTLELARDALADHLAQTDSAVTLGDIETVVAAFFGITPADLHSTRRTHTVSLARGVAMFLARRHTRMSFPEIGRFMGKNHSSAVLAVQRVDKQLQEKATWRWMTPAGPKSMLCEGLLELLTEQIA